VVRRQVIAQNTKLMADSEQSRSKQASTKPRPKRRRKSKKLPPFNVILMDDNDHTYDYVIEMLRSVFSHSQEQAFKMAKEVDDQGRVIVFTTHREHAELKREQIHAWGTDWRIASCKGSMTARIEPAN
jgi:ATP-dependent Clp protease adaptor protein ClpS